MQDPADHLIVQSSAIGALAESGCRHIRLMVPHVTARLGVVDGDVRVIDEEGSPRFTLFGEPMPIAELIAELRGDEKLFDRLWKG